MPTADRLAAADVPSAPVSMSYARIAALLTWVYVGGFGIPAIPVGVYLLHRGTLPRFLDRFPMYGGPWSSRLKPGTFVVILTAFFVVTLIAAWTAWLVWNGSTAGAVLNLVLLPVEAVFWIGLALPFPWPTRIATAVLLALAWSSLT